MFVGPGDSLDGNYFPEPEDLLHNRIQPHPDSFEGVYLMKKKSRFYGGIDVETLRIAL